MLRIHEILVRIRICRSIPQTNGSGYGFVSDLQGVHKNFCSKVFFGYYFLKGYIYLIFQRKKIHKEVTKQ
jgi:hypothetical protein